MKTPKCSVNIEHIVIWSEKHGACACLECNVWLSKKCCDPNCICCIDRPERPREE